VGLVKKSDCMFVLSHMIRRWSREKGGEIPTIQDRRHLRRDPLPKSTSSATDCVRNDRYAHGFCSTLRRNASRIVRTAAVFRDRQLSMYLPKSTMLSLALLRVLDLLRAVIYRFEHPRHISYVTYTLGQSNTWLVV